MECIYSVATGGDDQGRVNAGLMLGQRRRRWAIVKPTLSQDVISAELTLIFLTIIE